MKKQSKNLSNIENNKQVTNPDQLFSQAIILHQNRKLDEAETIARNLLTSYPTNVYVLNLLGIINSERGNFIEAIQLLEKAITINPSFAEAYNNHGFFLSHLKRYNDALASYDKAIALKPDYADAYKNRTILFFNLQKYREALENCDKVIAIRPESAEIYNDRGVILYNLERYEDAITSYDKAIAINANYAEAYKNRGVALSDMKRYNESLSSYDKAIALNSNYADAYNSRAIVLTNLRRYSDALADYNKAIAINSHFDKAYNNRGNLLAILNKNSDALASYNQAIAINPDYADACYNKGLLKLLMGEYEEGWKLHEWRWKKSVVNKSDIRVFDKPLWLGKESLAGKKILIYAEQGLGDTIQFCRYVNMVEALGASIILEVQAPLAELVSTLSPSANVIAKGISIPAFDFQCPLMSLPLALGTTVDTIPTNIPYLHPDPKKQQFWQELLGLKQRPRIGLVWSGAAGHLNDHNRSIALNLLTPLLDLDADFFSLQKEVRPDDQVVLANTKIISLTDKLKTFADTAAFISEMDLVISVDTSVAHLTGALGKPLWVLLPYVPDFRWLLNREDSPWYPTARPFRQQTFSDWENVVIKLKEALAIFAYSFHE